MIRYHRQLHPDQAISVRQGTQSQTITGAELSEVSPVCLLAQLGPWTAFYLHPATLQAAEKPRALSSSIIPDKKSHISFGDMQTDIQIYNVNDI